MNIMITTRTLLESILNDNPSISVSYMIDENQKAFEALGLESNASFKLEKYLKHRMSDWTKYTGSTCGKLIKDETALLTDDDISFIKAMNDGTHRVPITDVAVRDVNGVKRVVVDRRHEIVDVIAAEVYRRGNFGPTLYDSKTDFIEQLTHSDPDEERAWLYIKFTGEMIPEKPKAKTATRAF